MSRRTVVLVLLLLAALGTAATLFAPRFDDARVLRPVDYMEYWTAGRATLNGQNPYDGAVLYPMQLEIQKHHPEPFGDPIMMWNPPWTLPLAVPLAVVHWRVGQLVWFGLNAVGCAVAAGLLWRLYGGPKRLTWAAVAVAFAFSPTLFQLMLLNITGFLYLGLVGFVNLQKPTDGRPWALPLAGCLAALTAIKPHLFVPFAVLLLLETLRGQRVWRAVVAGGLMLAAFSLIPLIWNPDVWSQYRAATAAESSTTHYTTRDWVHPTLGYWIRELIPGRPFAALFLPLAVGVPLTVAYWWVRRRTWDWQAEMPRVVLASMVLTPYGAWGCDLVVLALPLMQATVWVVNSGSVRLWAGFAVGFVGLNVLALLRLQEAGSMGNPWITPAVLIGYVLAGMFTKEKRQESPRATVRGRELGVTA